MTKRRLAAIMFSDIVGYDSLQKEDEKNAYEIRKKNQRIHRRLIKKFSGRWLKEMESGTLASFSSNVDAVMCAVSIQKATGEVNIPLRIGIHQGDVIFEKKDVLGDGVNIASRIQGLADSYDIMISERVYDDIKNKEGLTIEFLGERNLKGVKKPTPVYKVSCKDESYLDFTIDTGELIRPLSFGRETIVIGIMVIALMAYALYYFLPENDDRPTEPELSILVLPPDNFTGTDTLDYLVAGIHNSIISNLGRISVLRVLSTTSARAYFNPQKSLHDMASDAGVDIVIKPEVLCSGDNICLNIQMFNPDDEERPLFDQEYNEDMSQILNVYNDITKQVSDEININLRPQEEKLLAESRTVDPEAYAAYLKGQQSWEQLSGESLLKALEYFQIAIQKDPDWAPPYAGLAYTWGTLGGFGIMPVTATLPNHYNYLTKTFDLDPNNAEAHFAAAITATWFEWDWEKGEREFKKSLDLYPNYALCRAYYAHLLLTLGRYDQAIYHAEFAVETDPLSSLVVSLYGQVFNVLGDHEKALIQGEKAISIDPDNQIAISLMYFAYQSLGNYEEWFKIVREKGFSVYEQYGVAELLEKVFHEQGYFAFMEEAIRIHEEVIPKDHIMHEIDQAERYSEVKNYEKALDYYEKCYEDQYWGLAYISALHLNHPEIKDNPRYIALLKKMNLPLP